MVDPSQILTAASLDNLFVIRSGAEMSRLAPESPRKGNPGSEVEVREVRIPPVRLAGTLRIPHRAKSIVAFAHGSGSSRFSPRNMAVAEGLNAQGFATLLFDLLTSAEEANRANVFNIALLAERLADAVAWLDHDPGLSGSRLGLFGASTGAAAALVAAARLGDRVSAIVSRGGRPDLAGAVLDEIRTPTLLIVGGIDYGVIELNEEAFARLRGRKALEIVPGASHLFPEPGALETVIDHAARWFTRYLAAPPPGVSPIANT
jgi:pimeloyl-ACP methyl ester carboxylesterase